MTNNFIRYDKERDISIYKVNGEIRIVIGGPELTAEMEAELLKPISKNDPPPEACLKVIK